MPHADLDRTLDLLELLVAHETVSPRPNLALVDALERRLTAAGLHCRRLVEPSGTRASLVATLPSSDGDVLGGLVLSGHTDVVPTEGQDWTSHPFRARRDGERIYGRGTADMKGFVACAVTAVEHALRRHRTRPLHLALSRDEEIGCLGAAELVAALRPLHPDACLVGEPTGMQVALAHKGKIACACTVHGREAHSALPHLGANAVFAAAELVAWLAREADRRAREGPFADGFEPPHTTASVGRIEGGTQLNIVPARCRFEFEFRALPGESPRECVVPLERFARERVLPRLRARAPEAEIAFETLFAYPGLAADPHAEFSRLCMDLAGTSAPRCLAFGTEAGFFHEAGISTVVCGPGDMAVAHRPDEYVTIDQLDRCMHFLDALIERVTG